MDTATLQSILRFFFWTVLCLLPFVFVVLFFYSTAVKLGQQTAHEKLGESLGFRPLNRQDNRKLVWYGGQVHGRAVAINTIISTPQDYAPPRIRRGYNVGLRIAMAVHRNEPPGITAHLNKNNKTPLSFEETFTLEQGEASPAAREAMLAFAFRGHRTGLRRDLRVAVTRGIRELRIVDRATAPNDLLDPDILAGASAILIHDHPFVDISPAELRIIFDELSTVAEAIETDQVPPLLAGQTTPPADTSGRNAYLLFIGLGVIGVPACLCVCGMINSFLLAYR